MSRHAIAAVGFVLVVVAAFALIGGGADEERALEDPAPTAEEDASAARDVAEPEDADRSDDAEDPADSEHGDGVDPPDGEPGTGEAPDDGMIDPSTITIQVLDGYQQDGGAAASGVVEELREAGYRVVAENPAIAYEITTVLWNEGLEAEARQVAEAIGAAEVRVQPGNLSAEVMVHVVVGADRA